MKKLVALVLCVSVLTSCVQRISHQLRTECKNKTPEEVFQGITSILIQEGFTIKTSDVKLGLLEAETPQEYNIWIGMLENRVWTIQIYSDTLSAFAKHVIVSKNLFGATNGGAVTYYNDEVHHDWTWYWNVRNRIESLCGCEITWIDKAMI